MAREGGKQKVKDIREMSSSINSGLRSLKIFKATNNERFIINSLLSSNLNYLKANVLSVKSKRYLEASQNIIQLFGFTVGLYFVRDYLMLNLIEIGFLGYVYIKLYTHVANISKKYQVLTNNIPFLKRVKSFINELDENKEHSFGNVIPKLPSQITIKDISFKFGKVRILDKISFTIPKFGLSILFGISGVGKTTLLDLITGLYKIEKGEILVGKTNIRNLKISTFRNNIGYVTQDPFLMIGSIKENITSFREEVKESNVVNVAKMSGLKSLIEKLPDGLNSQIGESGANLSGGEKQRLAIARSLVDSPKLILMDEPTSALDETISNEIMVNIKKISKKIPIVMITHKKEFIKFADVAYELKKKKIIKIK